MLRSVTAVGFQKAIAICNRGLGEVYTTSRDYEKAISCLKVSFRISMAIGDQSLIRANNSNLGDIYAGCLKKYEIAIDVY